ncbi:hypothetical protein NB311A_12112 [Nitrobacter sp. Nb-311A]|uniref:hypothetical protein n=1 Tax=Nitrobacter sp. Nb-311A TaxID=314253 RepID=UPI00006852FF|nr:hypothetical protein [Nitrobacter sp. Nb-311A]EAQ34486.1 hypothetical protein NB311A_12112 [Nitrobacter sp. Nb-311A]
MVDAWPETLPRYLLLDSFREGLADSVLEYAPDVGPPISRRRTTAATRPMSGQMVMTGAQFETLRTFFDETLLGGSLPFEFPSQTAADETLLVKFPKGSAPTRFRLSNSLYRVDLTLMVLP